MGGHKIYTTCIANTLNALYTLQGELVSLSVSFKELKMMFL